ncbi:MAG TPA: type IV toxin-antitoxin system AbiEi family antitoxin domain-containing protein [Acidimicrobiales bacterium]|nr:type IV toxin-antitoxin system AbiEi family antitoxin domain-containing protein [Acidimicrobiales bacterium]
MGRDIVVVAEKQHGVFTLAQARDAGFTRSAIRHRLASGYWEPTPERVLRVRGSPRTWEQRVVAATLAAGPSAAASHRSAAALLGFPGFERRGPPEVTVARSQRRRTVGGVVHLWRPFPEHHLTVIDGIVTTRVPRTLVDLAGVVHPRRTARAVDNCLAAGVATFATLQEAFFDLVGRGRKGIAVMRRILAERGPAYVSPASELEVLFLERIRDAGLPEPVRQFDAGDAERWIGRVDFAYPHVRALIEVDGRRYHTSLLDREADARRDAALLAGGWSVVERFGWGDIVHRPETMISRLRYLLLGAAA